MSAYIVFWLFFALGLVKAISQRARARKARPVAVVLVVQPRPRVLP